MRTLRVSLAGTVIVALATGLGGAVLAQADDESDMPVTATYVTAEVTGHLPIAAGSREQGEGFGTMTDDQYQLEIAWSDPRLPSLKRGRENASFHHKGDDLWPHALAGSIRLEGPQGAWAGRAHGMADDDAVRGRQMTKVMNLEGEDAYEGLYAVLIATIDEAVTPLPSYEGFIFEGVAPPLPESVEPFTE